MKEITRKEFLDYLIKLVGKEVRSKYNPEQGTIISGIAHKINDREDYVIVVNPRGGGFHDEEDIDRDMGIVRIFPEDKYMFKYFSLDGSGIGKYNCFGLREFFDVYYFLESTIEFNLSYLPLCDARKIFTCDSGNLEELKMKLLCIYSRRELLCLPEKIDNVYYPKDVYVGGSSLPYPNQKTLDSAIAFQRLVWLVGEYKSRWRDEMGLSIFADLDTYKTYCIVRVNNRIEIVNKSEFTYTILSFPDYNLADIFYKDHCKLIEQYYIL